MDPAPQSVSRPTTHIRINEDQYRQTWRDEVEGPMARFGLNLSMNLRHPNRSDSCVFGRNIGIGMVEFNVFSGSIKSFVARNECRWGGILVGLVGEDLFPGQNRNLTRFFEG